MVPLFTWRPIRFATVLLFTWEQIPPGAHQSSEFLSRFEGRGQSIHIEMGQTVDAQLNLIPAVN